MVRDLMEIKYIKNENSTIYVPRTHFVSCKLIFILMDDTQKESIKKTKTFLSIRDILVYRAVDLPL